MMEERKNRQSEEDYLESILWIEKSQSVVHRIDVARRLNVSPAAVDKAVKLLIEKGYVSEDGKHLVLTESGVVRAKEVFEKHCLLREFLLSLGVSKETAEDDACRMEHAVSDETFERIKAFVGNHKTEN